ncbi:MAG: corrinoid-binding protein, partial [Bacteroidetes bacterium]|nr:corrinoid-binding protein [Bacteroidota bacterium]
METLTERQNILLEFLLEAEKDKAGKLILDWAYSHSFQSALIDLFQPVLDRFGNLWYEGRISLAQGYVAGLRLPEDVFLAAF